MTAVVGVKGKNGVLLAGDAQSSTVWSNRKMGDAKAASLSEVLAFAACGSGRVSNLLTYHMEGLDDPPLGTDEMRWMVKHFIPHLRDVAYAHGALLDYHNIELLEGSGFIMAVRGRMFTVEEDLQVGEHLLPYEAMGSGGDAAIGAMRGVIGDAPAAWVPESKVEKAALAGIAAASEFTNFVGGPVSMVSTVVYTDDELDFMRSVVK